MGNRGGAGWDEDKWELYNLQDDFTQATDLAKKEPAKLRELRDLFMAEAAKYTSCLLTAALLNVSMSH